MNKSAEKMGSRLPPDKATSGSKKAGKKRSSKKNRRINKQQLKNNY